MQSSNRPSDGIPKSTCWTQPQETVARPVRMCKELLRDVWADATSATRFENVDKYTS